MIATRTPQRPVGEGLGAEALLPIAEVHDALGRAHYERMRVGMAGQLTLPPWEDLAEGTRTAHRYEVRWLLPTVVELTRKAAERINLALREAS